MIVYRVSLEVDTLIDSAILPTIIEQSPVPVVDTANVSNQPHIDLMANDSKIKHTLSQLEESISNFSFDIIKVIELKNPDIDALNETELFRIETHAEYIEFAVTSRPCVIPADSLKFMESGDIYDCSDFKIQFHGNEVSLTLKEDRHMPNMYVCIWV